MKVFIDPPNSLVLYDLVERFGHQPLSAMAAIQERVDNLEVDMPPMNVSLDDVVRGLKYAGVEVPSGIRGRLALRSKTAGQIFSVRFAGLRAEFNIQIVFFRIALRKVDDGLALRRGARLFPE